jgi:toxin FitB
MAAGVRRPACWAGVSFIVLDTDVASTILRGRLADPLRSRLAGHSLCITFVTLGELIK